MIISNQNIQKTKKEAIIVQSEMDIKQEMCEIGKRVYNRGMVAANDGNFSVN